MKRILITINTAFVEYGGLATVMLNYYRAMNKKDLQIDFVSTNEITPELDKELQDNNSHYYNIGMRTLNLKIVKYLYKLSRVLKKGNYDVIHINGNSSTMILELLVARMHHIPVKMVHGHNSHSDYPKLHKFLLPFFVKLCDIRIATAKLVGDWLYGGAEYIVLNNAIDTTKYMFNPDSRMRCRERLGISDKFVIGHVGKMNAAKNHHFILKVFQKMKQKRPEAVLLLVGDGPLRHEIEKECQQYHISDSVILAGMQDDASAYLQAMDAFIFPSNWEGLGLALVEAQAAGLKCLASLNVPREAKASDNVRFLDTNSSVDIWVNNIMSIPPYDRMEKSKEACACIQERGYDIATQAVKLEQLYNMNKNN